MKTGHKNKKILLFMDQLTAHIHNTAHEHKGCVFPNHNGESQITGTISKTATTSIFKIHIPN